MKYWTIVFNDVRKGEKIVLGPDQPTDKWAAMYLYDNEDEALKDIKQWTWTTGYELLEIDWEEDE